MTEGLSSAADAGANELSRDGYIAMLAEGTGLNEDAAAAARAEWSALASLVEPLFDEFADGLMAGTLGGSGEPLDPLTRTVLSLSLEHIPAGVGKHLLSWSKINTRSGDTWARSLRAGNRGTR